jgi:hypothetical protein
VGQGDAGFELWKYCGLELMLLGLESLHHDLGDLG